MNVANNDIIIITGATASGKTAIAARLAARLGSEIISADSRQVYRGMDIGTGKDYSDYIVDGNKIKHHLIDIVDPGYKYNVYEYQRDFLKCFEELSARRIVPVVCGGSGMYIDSIVSGYALIQVPVNPELRETLEAQSLEELKARLEAYKDLHNRSDTDTKKRAVRAIEIQEYYIQEGVSNSTFPKLRASIFGVKFDRDSRRRRISERLKIRMDEGMIDEAKSLLDKGVSTEDLIYYGLEYKFLALYLDGKLNYRQMFDGLETAIHQFAKRQMTWFRSMEKKGVKIHWLDGYLPENIKIETILSVLQSNS